MENTFRRIIPDDQRFGSRFVFRQGNPLVPADLRVVAASKAASIIVVADTSRCPHALRADQQASSMLPCLRFKVCHVYGFHAGPEVSSCGHGALMIAQKENTETDPPRQSGQPAKGSAAFRLLLLTLFKVTNLHILTFLLGVGNLDV